MLALNKYMGRAKEKTLFAQNNLGEGSMLCLKWRGGGGEKAFEIKFLSLITGNIRERVSKHAYPVGPSDSYAILLPNRPNCLSFCPSSTQALH